MYKTISKPGKAEQTIERSRFIAHANPVSSREEADRFISEIRLEHRTATHNVLAMVIGDKFQLQWASDDGEPQGTSGAPIVQMLVKEGITNIVIVVTRYFGGIKLGTGGLVRAYTSSAKLGIEAAGICCVREMKRLVVKLDYSFFDKVRKLSETEEFFIKDTQYEEMVILTVTTEPSNVDKMKTLLMNITSGSVQILSEDEILDII